MKDVQNLNEIDAFITSIHQIMEATRSREMAFRVGGMLFNSFIKSLDPQGVIIVWKDGAAPWPRRVSDVFYAIVPIGARVMLLFPHVDMSPYDFQGAAPQW